MKHFATILIIALALTSVLGSVETDQRVEEDHENKGLKDRIKEGIKDGIESLAAAKLGQKLKDDGDNADSSTSDTDDEEKKGLKDRIKEGIEGLAAAKIGKKIKDDDGDNASSSTSDTSDAEEKKGLKDRIKEGVEYVADKVRSHKKEKKEKGEAESSSSDSESDSDEKKKGGLGSKIKKGIAAMALGKYGDAIADKIEPENDDGVVNTVRGVAADGLHAYVKVTELQQDVAKEGLNIAKDVVKGEDLKDRLGESYEKIKGDAEGIADNVIDGVNRATGNHHEGQGDQGSIGDRIKDAVGHVGDKIQEGVEKVKRVIDEEL